MANPPNSRFFQIFQIKHLFGNLMAHWVRWSLLYDGHSKHIVYIVTIDQICMDVCIYIHTHVNRSLYRINLIFCIIVFKKGRMYSYLTYTHAYLHIHIYIYTHIHGRSPSLEHSHMIADLPDWDTMTLICHPRENILEIYAHAQTLSNG